MLLFFNYKHLWTLVIIIKMNTVQRKLKKKKNRWEKLGTDLPCFDKSKGIYDLILKRTVGHRKMNTWVAYSLLNFIPNVLLSYTFYY